MVKFIHIIFITSWLFLLSSPVSYAQSSVLTKQNCQYGSICATFISSLPANSNGIDPNTNVSLQFFVINNATNSAPTCESGKQIYHAVAHAINGEAANIEYRASGAGASMGYDFNSLTGGTRNRYYGVFYCNSKQVDPSVLGSALGTFASQNVLWQTPEFNLTTRSVSGATVSVDNRRPSMGETIHISINGAGTGSSGAYKINGGESSELTVPGATPITVSKENGFNENANNTIAVTLRDSNGNQISLADDGVVTIFVSSNQSGGPGSPNSEPCVDPKNCLYNPLPDDELTHVFLIIIQGFLAIVGIWAVIFIIVGGFQMVAAAGNEEGVLKAKKTITYAILGLVIALLSFSMVAIVQNILRARVKSVSSTHIERYLS